MLRDLFCDSQKNSCIISRESDLCIFSAGNLFRARAHKLTPNLAATDEKAAAFHDLTAVQNTPKT